MCWYIVLTLAIVLTVSAGWMDLWKMDEMRMGAGVRVTKQHLWNDGLFLALIALFMYLRPHIATT